MMANDFPFKTILSCEGAPKPHDVPSAYEWEDVGLRRPLQQPVHLPCGGEHPLQQ